MTPQRIGFLRRFGLKTGIDFAPFGMQSGMVFEGTTAVFQEPIKGLTPRACMGDGGSI